MGNLLFCGRLSVPSSTRQTTLRIVIVGLDGAGKTTVFKWLTSAESLASGPTIGFNVDTVRYKSRSVTVWDLGGQNKVRSLWRLYFQKIQGLIFVIDCNDQQRIDEARLELCRILEVEELHNVPLLVLANKQDLPDAVRTVEIRNRLNLEAAQVHWIQPTCANTGQGLQEAVDWLSEEMNRRCRTTSARPCWSACFY